MTLRNVIWATAAMCVAAQSSGQSATNASKSMTIGGSNVLMQWSPEWKYDAAKAANTVGFTLPDAHALTTLIGKAPPNVNVANNSDLFQLVTFMAAQISPQSVEKDLEIKPLDGPQTQGYYFCATDPAPKPEEFKYLCQGAVKSSDVVLSFTVLYNDPGKKELERVLGALATIQAAKST